jgi:hypothetical protein
LPLFSIMKSLQTNRFILFFKDSEIIEKQSIAQFYKQIDTEVSPSTIDWRIHCLMKQKILFHVSGGMYSIKPTKTYHFSPSRKMKQLYGILTTRFKDVSYCFWEMTFLQQISNIQIDKNILIVETKRSHFIATQTYLRGKEKQSILLPMKSQISDYLSLLKEPLYILPSVEESPLHIANRITIPTVEKLLTDVLVYSNILGIQKQESLAQVFQQVSNYHTINTKSLLRYAARRNKKQEATNLLLSAGIRL